ncbi:uncharacterized protein [Magallana gigas]|uniref:uncharacterized protein n=1 Tax=Magallana gigas TaxID=29159 RepID=UPI00333E9F87
MATHSLFSPSPPAVRRKHICHQGHSHQNDEEVSKCNRQERKLQEMKVKHEIEHKVVDRDGAVHRQKIKIQGDPKRFFDGKKVPGMLAVEDKKGQKQKAKKH